MTLKPLKSRKPNFSLNWNIWPHVNHNRIFLDEFELFWIIFYVSIMTRFVDVNIEGLETLKFFAQQKITHFFNSSQQDSVEVKQLSSAQCVFFSFCSAKTGIPRSNLALNQIPLRPNFPSTALLLVQIVVTAPVCLMQSADLVQYFNPSINPVETGWINEKRGDCKNA